MMRKNINKPETIIIIHLSVKERPAALLSYAELPRRINTVGDAALKGQTVLASMEKALCSIPSPKNRKEKKKKEPTKVCWASYYAHITPVLESQGWRAKPAAQCAGGQPEISYLSCQA